jgi:ABC-type transporter Mla subunit MlaD
MREQAERRVSELKDELQKGQQMLAELEARQAELRQTLLRISGAIQVLGELLDGSASANGSGLANGMLPHPDGDLAAASAIPSA